MSIIEQIPSVTYKGNGTQTQFEFPFPILAEENLSVSIFNTIDKTTTELELGTDYDVVVENNEYPAENGYIIYMYKPTGEGLPVGLNLTIDRAVPYEQQSVYPPNTLLNPEQIENDLDNLEMQIQQLNLKDGRLITIPPGYDGSTEDYLEEFWDAVQNGGEQALNAADRAEDAADRAEDAADEAEAWAKEQGLWEMDDNNDLFPIENTPITADDDWELDENGDIMPRGTVSSLQYPTHVRVVDVFSKLQSLDLKTGQLVMTQGFYEPADGGGASYVCVDSLNEDETADGYGIIALNNGKYLKLRHNGILNVKWFGAKGDGAANDTKAIQKSLDYIAFTGEFLTLWLPKGEYKITNTLTVDAFHSSVYSSGCVINATDMQDSVCISIEGKSTDPISSNRPIRTIKGLKILCADENSITALSLGNSTTRACAFIRFENIILEKAYCGVDCKANSYILFFTTCNFYGCNIGYRHISGEANTGENINFLNCIFTANDLCMSVENIGCDVFLRGCSINYNKKILNISNKAHVCFTQCHLEANTNTTNAALFSAVGNSFVVLKDSYVYNDASYPIYTLIQNNMSYLGEFLIQDCIMYIVSVESGYLSLGDGNTITKNLETENTQFLLSENNNVLGETNPNSTSTINEWITETAGADILYSTSGVTLTRTGGQYPEISLAIPIKKFKPITRTKLTIKGTDNTSSIAVYARNAIIKNGEVLKKQLVGTSTYNNVQISTEATTIMLNTQPRIAAWATHLLVGFYLANLSVGNSITISDIESNQL